ncbi:hypothetical protein R6Z07F_016221 [Ovis aries]
MSLHLFPDLLSHGWCCIFDELGFTSTPLPLPRIRTEEAWVLLLWTSPNSKHLPNPARRKKMKSYHH